MIMTVAQEPGRSAAADAEAAPSGHSRRRFLAYVIAAPTVVAAARWASPAGATGAAPQPIKSAPGMADTYDLNDLLTDSTKPTADMITVEIHKNGTASFELPRVETGQGITTSTAMIIAEELD